MRLRKAFLTALILVLAAVGGWLFTIRTAFPGGGDALRVLAYGGRGEKPGEFTKGGPASDAALDRVKAGESLIVKDWSKDPPPGFSKTQSDWRSFVAVPIIGGDGYAYGMITVDSPTAGSFLDTELHTVTVVAEILSIAFTLAYPRTAR